MTPNEAFGLVQLEAHACGVPVVSTLLLEDGGLRARMGTRARERQRAEFSLDVMSERVLRYYDDLRSTRVHA